MNWGHAATHISSVVDNIGYATNHMSFVVGNNGYVNKHISCVADNGGCVTNHIWVASTRMGKIIDICLFFFSREEVVRSCFFTNFLNHWGSLASFGEIEENIFQKMLFGMPATIYAKIKSRGDLRTAWIGLAHSLIHFFCKSLVWYAKSFWKCQKNHFFK